MFLIIVFALVAGVIHPQLQEKLEVLEENETIEVIVHMQEQADLSALPEGTTKQGKLQYLQQFSKYHQEDILSYFSGFGDKITVLQTWWIFNGFMVSTTKNIIEKIAAREDVDYVIDDFEIQIGTSSDQNTMLTPEWNISKVSAPECWNDGFDGAGIIVGNIDTGVDVNHPAFHGRWVPGGWYDAINGVSDPYDDHGHGTHVMGVACGGDGNGPDANDIGVAPGANFIAAKG